MSRAASSRRCAAFLVAVALASLRGASDEAPPVTGIAAAKRDYAEVKAATGAGAEMQKLALPKTTQPSLDVSVGIPPPPPAPSISTRQEEEKFGDATANSKNWLVDALRKNPPGKSAERADVAKFDRFVEAEGNGADSSARRERNPKDQSLLADEKRGEAPRVRPSDVSNPLDRFMVAWMTPQDFKLLKSTPKGDSANEAAALPLSGALAPPSLTEFMLPSDAAPRRASEANLLDAPAANPYLAAMEVPAPVAASRREAMAGGLAPATGPYVGGELTAPRPPPEPLRPAAKENPAASDFQKAQDDAKYFKQLKRF